MLLGLSCDTQVNCDWLICCTNLPECEEGGPHAVDEFVEPLQLLQQYYGGGGDLQTVPLPRLLQVRLLGQLADHVTDHLVQVILPANPTAQVTYRERKGMTYYVYSYFYI